MASPNSRYKDTPVLTLDQPGGQVVRYYGRFSAPRLVLAPGATLQVTEGVRLDQIAARVLGDPLLADRLLYANPYLDPLDCVAKPGRRLSIPAPGR